MDVVEEEYGTVAKTFTEIVADYEVFLADPVTHVRELAKVYGYSDSADIEDKLKFWDVREATRLWLHSQ